MRVSLSDAAILLKSGHVVAVPTETVYGLAACVTSPEAIAHIFSLKGRPADNPLIVHVSSVEQVQSYFDVLPSDFHRLAEAFWPGPLTLILKGASSIPEIARAGLPTVAFRVPHHPMTLALLDQVGPLVMPSANISGRPSATTPEHVEEDFGGRVPVLDGGACLSGVESTILYLEEDAWKIARLGALPQEAFVDVLGYIPQQVGMKQVPVCPGQKYRHYAPKARLELVKGVPSTYQGAVIGFKDRRYHAASRVYSLGSSSNANEAVHHLYALLRQLDAEGVEQLMVDIDIPDDGLWLTLKERLSKAAGK